MVLFVGSLFNRRHIPELIAGFAGVTRHVPDARLEIVGDNRTIPRLDMEALVAASGVGDRVALRAYLPESELSALYARARAFVFLSEYEGFGLTPLEALSAGMPIVVLDTPVAREVYGAAALYVERPDPGLIEAALRRVLTDDAERTRILEAGRDTLARVLVAALRRARPGCGGFMLPMPRLSIVIVTFNSAKDIDACLASLTVPAAPVDFETVVVDNASSDGTAAAVRARWPGVRVLDAGGNLGFAGASNLGIRQTFGDLVLLLNPDTIVRPGALGTLVAALDARPDAAVAGPRLIDAQTGRSSPSGG